MLRFRYLFLRRWGRVVLLVVLVFGLMVNCGSPNKTGKLVGFKASFGLDDALDGVIDKTEFGGVVIVELADKTQVNAIWDKKLGTDFVGGMELEVAPTEKPDLWKVVRIVSTPPVKKN